MGIILAAALLLLAWVPHSASAGAAGPVAEYGPAPAQWVGSGFCETIIAPLGGQYSCSEHTVLAAGYILTLQNVWRTDLSPPSNDSTQAGASARGHVLFLHSTFAGGDIWFVADNPTPIALADKGYSIWIGNERGSKWTFGHQTLNPTQFEYWDWDADEVANYDWPALTSFIYQYTGGQKLHFVGYSQGARVGIGALCYQRSDYYASFTLLAPVVFATNAKAPLLQAVKVSDLGTTSYRARLPTFCLSCLGGPLAGLQNASSIKAIGIASLTGPNCCIDEDKVFDFYTRPHSCISTKAVAHLTQSILLENFQAYDFGDPNMNMVVYESYIPPTYILGNVSPNLPILVLYGGNDQFANTIDVRFLMSQLLVPPQSIYLEDYGHGDFVFSKRLAIDVNPSIVGFIESFSF